MPRSNQKKTQTRTQGFQIPVLTESEAVAVGCAVKDPDLAELVISDLNKSDIYGTSESAVYSAVLKLADDGQVINSVSVSERAGISRADVEEFVDRAQGVTSSQLTTIISDLQRVAALRGVFLACLDAAAAIKPDSKIDDITGLLEKGVYGFDRQKDDTADAADTMGHVVAQFFDRVKNGTGIQVSTGIKKFDDAIIGFRGGKVGVVAGRPGMGKTALCSGFRRAVCAQDNFGVADFALEMSREEMLERELAFKAQMGLRKILLAKDITPEEMAAAETAAKEMVHNRWIIDDKTYSIAGIRRKARVIARRMAQKGIKLKLVVVDYLQLAANSDNGEGREQTIAAVSRGCKFMAKELDCTVLAISQLNRACEVRGQSSGDYRPIMSDLRESGAIEQDADWILFVYRPWVYDKTQPQELAELILEKQRSGPTGKIKAKFTAKTVTFSDYPVPESKKPDVANG